MSPYKEDMQRCDKTIHILNKYTSKTHLPISCIPSRALTTAFVLLTGEDYIYFVPNTIFVEEKNDIRSKNKIKLHMKYFLND